MCCGGMGPMLSKRRGVIRSCTFLGTFCLFIRPLNAMICAYRDFICCGVRPQP